MTTLLHPEAPGAPTDALARLLVIGSGDHLVVSCYLKLEVRDRARRKYLVKLKNRIRDVLSDLAAQPLSREVRLAAARDLDRMTDFLRRSANLPPTEGVALFACEPLELFEIVPLPRVHRSRLVVDRTPFVRELLAAQEDFGRVLVAVVDRAHARFFDVGAFHVIELPSLHAPATRGGKYHSDRHGAPGMGERRYHGRQRAEAARHYHAVAERLAALDRSRPVAGFVLAGPPKATNALAGALPRPLTSRVLGFAALNPSAATAATARTAALEAEAGHHRGLAHTAVTEMVNSLATGWAENGLKGTLRALLDGHLRSLLVRADTEQPGFRCHASGRLVLTAEECGGEGIEHVPDLVDDAIEEALRQGLPVLTVGDATDAAQIDVIAGIRRFA